MVSAGPRDRTYYLGILGLGPEASSEEIRRAYKKKALRWHPDKNRLNTEFAEEKFKEIGEAYEYLTKPQEFEFLSQIKRSYDYYVALFINTFSNMGCCIPLDELSDDHVDEFDPAAAPFMHKSIYMLTFTVPNSLDATPIPSPNPPQNSPNSGSQLRRRNVRRNIK